MLQALGVMVAFYVITRMAELIDRKDRSMALKALASVTMIIAVISLFRLLGGAPPSLF